MNTSTNEFLTFLMHFLSNPSVYHKYYLLNDVFKGMSMDDIKAFLTKMAEEMPRGYKDCINEILDILSKEENEESESEDKNEKQSDKEVHSTTEDNNNDNVTPNTIASDLKSYFVQKNNNTNIVNEICKFVMDNMHPTDKGGKIEFVSNTNGVMLLQMYVPQITRDTSKTVIDEVCVKIKDKCCFETVYADNSEVITKLKFVVK